MKIEISAMPLDNRRSHMMQRWFTRPVVAILASIALALATP